MRSVSACQWWRSDPVPPRNTQKDAGWRHQLDLWFFDHYGTDAPMDLVTQLRIEIDDVRRSSRMAGRKQEYITQRRLWQEREI